MPKSRKRKNNDLLSPLPTKMSRHDNSFKASVKVDHPSLKGTVAMHLILTRSLNTTVLAVPYYRAKYQNKGMENQQKLPKQSIRVSKLMEFTKSSQ